jgi:hypothetical protein
MTDPTAAVDSARATAYTVPTDAPEADGTYAWDKTTLILAEVTAGGRTGLGPEPFQPVGDCGRDETTGRSEFGMETTRHAGLGRHSAGRRERFPRRIGGSVIQSSDHVFPPQRWTRSTSLSD